MASRIRLNNSKRVGKLTVFFFVCLLVLPFEAAARTLAEYGAGLKIASESVGELIDYVDEAADDESLRDAEYEREILAEIRKALPATEKVELEGMTVETGNEWLEAKLKAFAEEKDWSKRRAHLSEARERLAALDFQINQRKPRPGAERSKDEDKQKLAEILRRAEYQKPEEKQESWFERLQRKIREWFNEKFPQPDIPQGAEQGMRTVSLGLQVVLYAVVLGFIAFVIYRFAPLFSQKFRRREPEDKGERVILGEKLSANEDSQTLFDETEALARGGNLRGAIRKGYIALLCELSDRKIIGLAQHKTNRDYLRDVRKKRELYENMNGLTASFERHWYGFESADEMAWQEFKRNYQEAIAGENRK